MIPFGQAQRVLKVKLTVDDIEREVHGGELDAAERLLWRRWVENENARQVRKSRVQVPCCGRFQYRNQIEQDSDGNWWCNSCCNAAPMCMPRPAPDPAHEGATLPAPVRKADVEVVDDSEDAPRVPPGDAAAGSAPEKSSRREDWRWDTGKRPTKRRRHALTGAVDFLESAPRLRVRTLRRLSRGARALSCEGPRRRGPVRWSCRIGICAPQEGWQAPSFQSTV